jgi:signal transduction histidine kinase/ActR/RegA family two-component response regulator
LSAAASAPQPLVDGLDAVAQALLSVAPYPMAVLDLECRFVAVNAALTSRTGLDEEGYLGRAVHELVSAGQWDALGPLYRRALAGEELSEPEVELDPGGGPGSELRRFTMRPVRIDGAIVGIAVSFTDEPMRALAERELQLRTDLYRMLSRTARAATACSDAQELYEEICRIVVETGRFRCAWVGVLEDGELPLRARAGDDGGYLDELVVSLDPEDPRSQGPTGRAALLGVPTVFNDFLSSARTEPWKAAAARTGIRSSASIPFIERGTVVATLSVYADVTGFFTDDLVETLGEIGPTVSLALDRFAEARERERHELQSRALEDQLRQSAKMEAIGTLAGGVAHDFNNTLTVIRNTVQLLLDGGALTAEQRERLSQIDFAAQSAAGLTSQLLTFGRRQVRNPQTLSLDDEVRATVTLIERLVRESITVELDLDAGASRVHIDRTEFQQVVLNLAANARDAMPHGGTLEMRTRVVDIDEQLAAGRLHLEPGTYAFLEVADSGVGMDAETLDRMFDPFFTTKELGTGLGLATVFGIVRGSGGHVWAYSEPGLGTTLRLYFPVAGAVETAGAPVEAAAEAPRRGGGETILVVEDSEMLRPLVGTILGSAGYSVILAADGVEALERVDAHDGPIDLVLTDVVMPRMSGGELAVELERRQPGVRVLFTSGYPADTVVRHGIAEARVSFVQKPYVASDLLRQVRSVLDRNPA